MTRCWRHTEGTLMTRWRHSKDTPKTHWRHANDTLTDKHTNERPVVLGAVSSSERYSTPCRSTAPLPTSCPPRSRGRHSDLEGKAHLPQQSPKASISHRAGCGSWRRGRDCWERKSVDGWGSDDNVCSQDVNLWTDALASWTVHRNKVQGPLNHVINVWGLRRQSQYTTEEHSCDS